MKKWIKNVSAVLKSLGFSQEKIQTGLSADEWKQVTDAYQKEYGTTLEADKEANEDVEDDIIALSDEEKAAIAAQLGVQVQDVPANPTEAAKQAAAAAKQAKEEAARMAHEPEDEKPAEKVSAKQRNPFAGPHTAQYLYGIEHPMFARSKWYNNLTASANPRFVEIREAEQAVFEKDFKELSIALRDRLAEHRTNGTFDRLDFNAIARQNALQEYINRMLDQWEKMYPFEAKFDSPALRFRWLIEAAHQKTGQKVVVLIDEYDKPLLDLLETGNTDDERQLQENRDFLKDFFSVFKAADEHLRFVLLTGVTKFSQVSMFSGFNQPDDISLTNRFDTLLGITEEELHTVFDDSISELAEELELTEEQTKEQLKAMYDGYHFSQKLRDVYNPFSIINCFANNQLGSYWFRSGTPSLMMRLLANTQEEVMQYTGQWYQERMFIDYKADREMPLPMIFQAGYLTIKDVNKEFGTYLLDFPNREVQQGLVTLLASNYLQPRKDPASWVSDMVYAMRQGNTDRMRQLFTSFLAETPYSMRPKKDEKDRELYFHYTFYLLMRLISCYTVYTEKQLSEGRADCIVETPQHVYIFEFKLDGTASEALQQISDKGYARAYEADQRQLHLIGASFSSKTGTIEEWNTPQQHTPQQQ